jgi:trk system potassium uptake protein TrkA
LSTAARIARLVKRGALVSAESLGFSGAEILQYHLGASCRWLGRPLSKLSFPRQAVLGAVIKGHRIITPRGDTVLQAGDQVIVFALPAGVKDVEKFFAAE